MISQVKFDIDVALALRKEGREWRDIARILSEKYEIEIHPYSVQFALTSRKLATDSGGSGRRRKWDLNRAIEMRKEGATLGQIAKVMGVSSTAIAKGLREVGL